MVLWSYFSERDTVVINQTRTPSLTFLYTSLYGYLSLHVGLLDGVADDLTVAIVFGWLPLQCSIEPPDVCDVHSDGRTGLVWWVCEGRDESVGFSVKRHIC